MTSLVKNHELKVFGHSQRSLQIRPSVETENMRVCSLTTNFREQQQKKMTEFAARKESVFIPQ